MTSGDPEVTSAAASEPQVPRFREVTEAKALRVLAHPVRLALIEVLSVSGPMTATQAGERIGETPTTCSFHLRQLAKYGFVEEAGGGRGRSRPWQMTSIGMRFAPVHDDPEAAIAGRALATVIRERQLDPHRTWVETRSEYPRPWQEAAISNQHVLYVTPAELAQLNEELSGLVLSRYWERVTDPTRRPPGSAAVELLMFGYPMGLPETRGDERGPGAHGKPDRWPPATSGC
jgi:DNA-binding transcriptional ArsR family regulator